MIGWLRTRVRKQPIIMLYFESENELKFYNPEARLYKILSPIQVSDLKIPFIPGNKCDIINE